MLTILIKTVAGIVLDRLLGEPSRHHPLVAFGRWAAAIERQLRTRNDGRGAGALAWALAVLPWCGAAMLLRGAHPWLSWGVDIGLLYFALGARSLNEHARAVAEPLHAGRLDEARARVGHMVSRDTSALDTTGVSCATTESVLENGNDAVFGALFWFLLLGGPGALLFRLANTLDAMWGYRTPRFVRFGWAAARIDDGLNWVPARLTALTYAVLGNWRSGLDCWRVQAAGWDSPNAGPVMAAGAGSLQVLLGGAATYHGKLEARPPLGCGQPAEVGTIARALRLVERGMVVWVLVFAAATMLSTLAWAGDESAARIELVDEAGRPLRLDGPAQRIVSLAPHVTELLFAAGAGSKVVGVVAYSNYPQAATQLPQVGGYASVNLEAVLALRPDLIVAWQSGNREIHLDRFEALGIPVYLNEPRSLAAVADSIEALGRLAGTEGVATQAARDFRARHAALAARFGARPPVRMFYQIWHQPLMTINDQHLISDVIRLCGGHNVFGELSQLAPKIGVEGVLAAQPEVIVASGMGEARPEWVDDWRRWPQLLATASDNLFFIPPDLIQRHTPRILDGATQLCDFLEVARSRRDDAPAGNEPAVTLPATR